MVERKESDWPIFSAGSPGGSQHVSQLETLNQLVLCLGYVSSHTVRIICSCK